TTPSATAASASWKHNSTTRTSSFIASCNESTCSRRPSRISVTHSTTKDSDSHSRDAFDSSGSSTGPAPTSDPPPHPTPPTGTDPATVFS
ncbi:hypothetical protein AAVH_42162, partial [Aphelenchoides avenae]